MLPPPNPGAHHSPEPMDVDGPEHHTQHDADHDVHMSDAEHDHDADHDRRPLPDREDPHQQRLGLEPDAEQQALRDHSPVHRIDLDHVHDQMHHWAEDGRLSNLMEESHQRLQAERAALKEGEQPPPTAFTHQELEHHLGDEFRRMNDGERMAVVATLARVSSDYHESQGVGHNPNHDSQPYADSGNRADGTPDPAKASDRPVSAQSREDAKPNFPPKYRKEGDAPSDIATLHERLTGKSKAKPNADEVHSIVNAIGRHKPDFSGKNYAVVEVTDHKGNTTYIVDSSVPADRSGVTPRHSERHLLDWVERQNSLKPDGQKYTVASLYTEREPCGSGQGHAHCSRLLDSHTSPTHGKPVYYSTTYRTDPEGLEARSEEREKQRKKYASQIEKANQIQDEGKRREQLKSISKTINNAVKKVESDAEKQMTGEMDRHLRVVGQLWAKSMTHIVPPQASSQ
ncbi:hypothetical protein SALB_04049 [Streptomyces noursei]|uniref:Uncharacterized protein n=2 Tax=Streptomyces noursei TaxID=1971 RepID=A0A401R136_STRNR|nr:hypothetical protein SALB_04049 [Streptomyces noursei]